MSYDLVVSFSVFLLSYANRLPAVALYSTERHKQYQSSHQLNKLFLGVFLNIDKNSGMIMELLSILACSNHSMKLVSAM